MVSSDSSHAFDYRARYPVFVCTHCMYVSVTDTGSIFVQSLQTNILKIFVTLKIILIIVFGRPLS